MYQTITALTLTTCGQCPLSRITHSLEGDGVMAQPADCSCKHPHGQNVGVYKSVVYGAPPPSDCPLRTRPLTIEIATPAGDVAIGYLIERLRKSPHAGKVKDAGPWPAGWGVCGSAVNTPHGLIFELVEDLSDMDVRGAEYVFTVANEAMTVEGVEVSAPLSLVERGVPPIRAAVWTLIEEWGTPADKAGRDTLLTPKPQQEPDKGLSTDALGVKYPKNP